MIKNKGTSDVPWLVHWEDPITNEWVGEHKITLSIARKKVHDLEMNEKIKSIYIQHIDGEVVYHKQNDEIIIG